MTPLTDAHTHRLPREPDQNALVNLNWNFLPESRPAGVYFSLGIHPKDADSISLEQLKNAVRQTFAMADSISVCRAVNTG